MEPCGSCPTVPIRELRKRRLRKRASHQATQLGSPSRHAVSRLAGDARGVFRLAGWVLTGASSFICEMYANKGNHSSWASSKDAKEKRKQAVHSRESVSRGWRGCDGCGRGTVDLDR